MRSENHIEMRELLRQLIAVTLSDATSHRNDALAQRRTASHGYVLQGGNLTIQARICRFAHAACHVDQYVSFLYGVHHKSAKTLEHTCNAFGVVFVHLTSEGADAKGHIHEGSLHKDMIPIVLRM